MSQIIGPTTQQLSQLAPLTTAAGALAGLILVTPTTENNYQPQPPATSRGVLAQLPPTLVFNYEGEQTLTLESDITDHFTEDNTAIQDQVSLKPILITAHGFIGELNDIAPSLLKPLKTVATKLTVISAYTPVISETAIIAYNETKFLYDTRDQLVNAAVAAWSSLSGTIKTKQQLAFEQFYGYQQSRILFTVQTPWGSQKNMAIKTLRAIQDAETRMISDFEITFKQMRFANSTSTSVGTIYNKYQARSADQASTPVDLGPKTGAPTTTTFGGMLNSMVA